MNIATNARKGSMPAALAAPCIVFCCGMEAPWRPRECKYVCYRSYKEIHGSEQNSRKRKRMQAQEKLGRVSNEQQHKQYWYWVW